MCKYVLREADDASYTSSCRHSPVPSWERIVKRVGSESLRENLIQLIFYTKRKKEERMEPIAGVFILRLYSREKWALKIGICVRSRKLEEIEEGRGHYYFHKSPLPPLHPIEYANM